MPDTLCTTSFALNGVSLRLTADDEKQIEPLRQFLGPLERPCDEPEVYPLTVRTGSDDIAPGDWPVRYDGELLEKVPGVLRESEERLALTIPGRLSIVVEPDRADAVVATGRENSLGGTAAVLVLEAALRRVDQHLVHAACLELPDRSGVVVLFAPSGVGKTTTSLILSRTGFRLAGDDCTIIAVRPDGFSAWALPRAFRVHRNTVALLPWLETALGAWPANDDEQAVAKDAVRDLVAVTDGAPGPVRAIILLGERTGGDHVIQPIDKASSLIALAHDNVPAGPAGVAGRDATVFQVLGKMLSRTPAYSLRVGRDPDTLGQAITAALI